jgi:hypothetical protein
MIATARKTPEQTHCRGICHVPMGVFQHESYFNFSESKLSNLSSRPCKVYFTPTPGADLNFAVGYGR